MLGILGGKKVLHMCLLVLGRNWGFHSIETISLRNIMHAKLLQSFQTLCDPMDCSPPRLLSMKFPRGEYWSGLPCPPPGESSPPRD